MEVAYSEALRGWTDSLKLGSGVLPLNRLETGNWDLLAALPALGGSGALVSAGRKICELTGREHVSFAASGRAAIAQVLSLLPQEEVIMPAYTCAVVKLAAQAARKRIIYADVAPGTVNSTSVEFERHARPGRIIIATHLFGIPTDIEKICELAAQRECVTIEDAAAAVGARYGRGVLGTFADIGVYSFERSKRFPAFRGAAIVVNNPHVLDPRRLAEADMFRAESLPPFREIAFAIMDNIARTPWLYGKFVVPRQLQEYSVWTPKTGTATGPDAFNSEFFRRRFHPYQAALLSRMLSRIGSIREHIGKLVSIYKSELRGSAAITFLPEGCDDTAILRLPVAIPAMRRADILRLALQRGLFLETNYEKIVADEISIDEFPNAQWAAQNVFLLPLYTLLSEQNARRIVQEIVSIADNHSRAGS
jgi:dTDP-4-amino-4,6-dideoxygalactose transaminase